MQKEYNKARELRFSLDKEARLRQKMLSAADQNAMSVLSKYNKPLTVVHATMRAVLFLLGVKLRETEVFGSQTQMAAKQHLYVPALRTVSIAVT